MTAPLAPLDNVRVLVSARGVAALYAGRMLGSMGAAVTLVEPEGGMTLRREPPFLDDAGQVSALFAYCTAGMDSRTCDLDREDGRAAFDTLAAHTDILIDDTPVAERGARELTPELIERRYPDIVHVSVLPFGATGPKAHWAGEDITLQHASGEGNLLPNGLSVERFPDRPPVKIHGQFAQLQGGIAAALGALTALWARPASGGQFVDISIQDANLAVGAFAIQRLGDGFIEHRVERSFRYGGVIPCADGHVELLTLEQRQWDGLVSLLGKPGWACDPALADPLERGRRGPAINHEIRAWASTRQVADIVREGQAMGVPLAKYYTPDEVLRDPHERLRGLFQSVHLAGVGAIDMLVSPFHFDGSPLVLRSPPLQPGDHISADRFPARAAL